jgi:hypothetical protein
MSAIQLEAIAGFGSKMIVAQFHRSHRVPWPIIPMSISQTILTGRVSKSDPREFVLNSKVAFDVEPQITSGKDYPASATGHPS